MKIFNIFKSENKKIIRIKQFCLKACLIIALIAALTLSFYNSTYILFQFFLGITLLKFSVSIFSSTLICTLAFNKMLNEL